MVSPNGIDTESIVTQLMAVERRPQDLMKTSVTTMQRAQNAWQAIADKLTAMKTAADELAGLDAASQLRTVSSSNPSVISVRTMGPGPAASSSIDVLGLAAAHSVLASDSFTAPTDSLAGRTLTLTNSSGTAVSITSADGTVGGLAAAVNAAGLGVNAKMLQTAPGKYQLSLAATSTGAAGAFTATGSGWTSFDVVRQGADAQLKVDGVAITRSTNVINDVLDGVELTLTALSTTPVNVSTGRDDAAIAAKVKAFVDAANALGTIVAAATKSGTTAADRGPLAADYTARQTIDQVRDVIAGPLVTASGAQMTASDLGVSLQKDGTITFDQAKLTASLASRPADVLAALGRNASSTVAGVTVAGVTSAATTSSRSVTVTQAASQASMVGMVVPLPPPGTQISMNVVTPTGTVMVSFMSGSTWAETAGNLNAGLRAAGVKMTAVAQAGSIDLRADRAGTGQAFSVTGGDAIGLTGTATDGTNAAGTIDGVAFTANGAFLNSGGVILDIGTTAAQLAAGGGTVAGTVSLTNGLAGALSAIGTLGQPSGPVLASKATLQDQIDDLQKRISAYDTTLAQREQTFRARFTAMQDLISKLQANTSAMSSLGVTG